MAPPTPHPPADAQALVDLAAAHDLNIDPASLSTTEFGLDFRVAFARTHTGEDWVLRVPRRPEVMDRAAVEGRFLRLLRTRLSVDVPDWQVHTRDLIAYPLLPGSPGLTLTDAGEPEWHIDVESPVYAESLGKVLAQLHAVDPVDAAATGIVSRSPTEARDAWRSDIATVGDEFRIAPHLQERWTAWLDDDGCWPDHTVLTHGEIYPAHTLHTGERLTGIIDWTTAGVDDPAKDFAMHNAIVSPQTFTRTVERYVECGGRAWPRLADHCRELIAASPVTYGLFALATGEGEHRATAAALLDPSE